MSKLVLILVFHKPNFFLKAAILSWLLKMFESRSCSDKFSPLIRLNISARYASLQSQVSSMMRDASSALYSVRNTNSSSRSSKRRLILCLEKAIVLPCETKGWNAPRLVLHIITTFRNPLADPVGTRRGPPLVRGPQFENRWLCWPLCAFVNYVYLLTYAMWLCVGAYT